MISRYQSRSCSSWFVGYLIWAFNQDRNPTYKPLAIVGLLVEISLRGYGKEQMFRALKFVESLFKLGISPNMNGARSSE